MFLFVHSARWEGTNQKKTIQILKLAEEGVLVRYLLIHILVMNVVLKNNRQMITNTSRSFKLTLFGAHLYLVKHDTGKYKHRATGLSRLVR
jgi:hypothetical protein